MRLAIGFAVALAGCASSGQPGSDVDAQPGGDGSTVRPDAGLCGGIDQVPCGGIYVAKSGNDTAPGTQLAPVKTIAAGIAKAGAAQLPSVFVKAGIYDEQITMSPGITVIGGFDDAWAQNPATDTEIHGASPVVKFENLPVATALEGVIVKSADAVNVGESSFAITVEGSPMIELRDVTIEAGIGAAGLDGGSGVGGANGGPGSIGKAGVERSSGTFCDSRPVPTGGAGGTSACGRSGG
ncbi:MAG: DUF1565 domain-containing protein, partial [Myxococcota bacterium]|nr:DUF1565 domain-containing protein [Myxococcota bacterium]